VGPTDSPVVIAVSHFPQSSPIGSSSNSKSGSNFPSSTTTEENQTELILQDNQSPDSPVVATVKITGNEEPVIITRIENPPEERQVISEVIDVSFVSSTSSLNNEVEICIKPNRNVDANSGCLGFYDEQAQQWKCQDDCLEEQQSGLLCGKTDHFTNFAILLTGSSSHDGCHSMSGVYITGSWEGDLILTSCFIGVAVFLVVIIILLGSTVVGDRVALNTEARRIRNIHHILQTQEKLIPLDMST